MLFKTVSDFRASGLPWEWGEFFKPEEFACKCGGRYCAGEYWHDAEFLHTLETARMLADQPFVINSGHRCAQWNARVGGAPLSMHRTIAADISLWGRDRHGILRAAEIVDFTGLGLARTFLHVDLRARPALWYYSGSEISWRT